MVSTSCVVLMTVLMRLDPHVTSQANAEGPSLIEWG